MNEILRTYGKIFPFSFHSDLVFARDSPCPETIRRIVESTNNHLLWAAPMPVCLKPENSPKNKGGSVTSHLYYTTNKSVINIGVWWLPGVDDVDHSITHC